MDMQGVSPKSAFWLGIRDGLPFLLVVAPFALLFGVVSAEAGLPIAQTMAFSVAVFAGAAQFTALQLLQDNVPTVIVILTALAVNTRMAMYSAALTPYLGQAPLGTRIAVSYFLVDQSYACASVRFDENRDWSLPARIAYFFGTVCPVYPVWMGATLVGALVGSAIPGWLALDFALPICFLAVIAPMLRTLAHRSAALTSITLALALAWMPFNLGLLIAAMLAMMVGAQVELWQSRTNREATT